MTYEMTVKLRDVKKAYQDNHKGEPKTNLSRVYQYAYIKLKGIKRGNGEPYINHTLRVARLVAQWGLGIDAVTAAILHSTVEVSDTSLDEIAKKFGTKAAGIIDAVRALSDKDFENHTLTPEQKAVIKNRRLQKKLQGEALYVKIADRIDSLNTISGLPVEKRIPRAEHTREFIIPLAIKQNANYLVDLLEELCFEIEHPEICSRIKERCQSIFEENRRAQNEALYILRNTFDPDVNNEISELKPLHRYIVNFVSGPRSYVSIFRQISREAQSIKTDLPLLLTKKKVPLYDMALVVSDQLNGEDSVLSPNDIFFRYFDKALSLKGFYLISCSQTYSLKTRYFLLADEMDNLYRLFVRTEREHRTFMFGDFAAKDGPALLPDINEIEPRDSYNEKIKVFRENDVPMLIDKGATVLDFAFHIHGDIGLHFSYATLDNSKTQLPAYTRLNEGDTIKIHVDQKVEPDITWFKYVKTSRAVHFLVQYLQNR